MVTTQEVQDHLVSVLGVDSQHVRTADDPGLSLTTILDCVKCLLALVSVLWGVLSIDP